MVVELFPKDVLLDNVRHFGKRDTGKPDKSKAGAQAFASWSVRSDQRVSTPSLFPPCC